MFSSALLARRLSAPLEVGVLMRSARPSLFLHLQIEVTFEVDANGILNVAAEDKGTGACVVLLGEKHQSNAWTEGGRRCECLLLLERL